MTILAILSVLLRVPIFILGYIVGNLIGYAGIVFILYLLLRGIIYD